MTGLSPTAAPDWHTGKTSHWSASGAAASRALTSTARTDTRAARPAGPPARGTLATRATRTVADVREDEVPLVVMSAAALVNPDGRFLALAADAHDAGRALNGTERAADLRARLAELRTRLRRTRPTRRGAAGLRLRILARLDRGADGNDVEFPVFRHGILVFLPKESLLDEDVDARREVARTHLPLVVVDRPCVLFASEDQLRFLFPLGLVTPDRHCDGHQQHHYADADQQGRHRIPALSVLTP
jgi:hypothetical protein